MIRGRFSIGATWAIAVIAPVNKPADPRPAIARPTIKALDEGAVAHTKEPTSKIRSAIRNTVLTGKKV